MNRIARVVSAMITLALASPARAEPSVSLASVLEAGHRHHPLLAKQPLLAEALELQTKLINQAYLPRLSLSGQATLQSDVTSIAISVPGVTITPPRKDQYKVTLDLQQTIWDGGATSSQKRVATQRTLVEKGRVELDWYQVRDRIIQLYFAGVVQQELAAQAEDLVHHLDTVIEKAELARKQGVVIERDVLLAQARQVEARQAHNDARAQLVSVRRSLADLTGATLSASAALETPAITCTDSAARVDARTLRRPELGVLDAQRELVIAQQRAEEAADQPRIGAFGTVGYGRPGLNALSDEFKLYAVGGIQITVPLSRFYTRSHTTLSRQTTVQRALLDRQRDAVATQIEVQLDTQRAEVGRLDESLVLDQQLVAIRELVRVQTETQLALGTATMTDLVNDLSQEDQSRSRLAIHKTQRNLACHELAFIRGDL